MQRLDKESSNSRNVRRPERPPQGAGRYISEKKKGLDFYI
jgi:hypothetical protein